MEHQFTYLQWVVLGTFVVGLVYWFYEGVNFLLLLGCLHMLGYELSIHEIVLFDVFISIHEKKETKKKEGTKKKKIRKKKKKEKEENNE